MRVGRWLVVVAALWSPLGMACINEPGTDRTGRRFMADDVVGNDLVRRLTSPRVENRYWVKEARRIAADARKNPSFESLSRLGIVLVHFGKHQQAARLFMTIEARYPGHHETAANLGTSLELMGLDAVALRWIRIGIKRNVREHEGTEWLHARILEAKLGLQRDPQHLDSRSVAGVNFMASASPPLPVSYPSGNDGRPVTPYELNRAFHYQLQERLQFVKPKDAVVANLLEDWATLNLTGGPIENALALYPLARRYGAPETALGLARRRAARSILTESGDGPSGEGDCPICWPEEAPPPPPRG